MTGNDLISLAGHLIANKAFGNAEARHRSAVSRAYYGAFHLALEFLKLECQTTVKSNHTGHQEASNLFFGTNHPDAQDAARLLDELRSLRNAADYDLHKPRLVSEANARIDVEVASDFVSCLQRCNTEPVRSQIVEAIQRA